jgi:hypothetical protein
MPAIGPRAPARTFVAVRAIVPVTQMPPNSAEVRAVPPPAHRVGDNGREQTLDAAEELEGEPVGQHRQELLHRERRQVRRRHRAGNAAEARADRLDG